LYKRVVVSLEASLLRALSSVDELTLTSYLPPTCIGCLVASTQLMLPEAGPLPFPSDVARSPSFVLFRPHQHRLLLSPAPGGQSRSAPNFPYGRAYHGSPVLDQFQARPRHQAVFLMGILRALWDHQTSAATGRSVPHISNPSLIQSLRVSSKSYASDVMEWTHETVRLCIHSHPAYSYPPSDIHSCGARDVSLALLFAVAGTPVASSLSGSPKTISS